MSYRNHCSSSSAPTQLWSASMVDTEIIDICMMKEISNRQESDVLDAFDRMLTIRWVFFSVKIARTKNELSHRLAVSGSGYLS
jgi:hypothetical protein